MKLYKALKLKKSLVGEIVKLKQQIKDKNSYLVGSQNGKKFSVDEAYTELLRKIETLTALKYVINEANREIQSKIYLLAEYKALIVFWNEVSVVEGAQTSGYAEMLREYEVQYDENTRNTIVNQFQKKVDALQEELDTFNYTTDIPWGMDE
jgi:thymidylate synthase